MKIHAINLNYPKKTSLNQDRFWKFSWRVSRGLRSAPSPGSTIPDSILSNFERQKKTGFLLIALENVV